MVQQKGKPRSASCTSALLDNPVRSYPFSTFPPAESATVTRGAIPRFRVTTYEGLTHAQEEEWREEQRREWDANGIPWFTLDLANCGTGMREVGP